jgi:hypothetical protein
MGARTAASERVPAANAVSATLVEIEPVANAGHHAPSDLQPAWCCEPGHACVNVVRAASALAKMLSQVIDSE